MDIDVLRKELILQLASFDNVKGIGQTGNINQELIPGESDIDLFVLCSEIPTTNERKLMYATLNSKDFNLSMEVCTGGHWGYGDILEIDRIDLMPMYFTVQEMQEYLVSVLKCKQLNKDGSFYPVGRLASIASINILYEEDDTWTALKEMVNAKPYSFFHDWYQNEIEQVLDDEDLGRAESRKDVLFFHQVLENALDHLLQAIYAINDCYFPSRKRVKFALDTFKQKPENCYERLKEMILFGASEDKMHQAIEQLRIMTQKVKDLGDLKFDQ